MQMHYSYHFKCSILQLGLVMGLFLAVFLGISLQFAWRLFTKDANVVQLMRIGIPV